MSTSVAKQKIKCFLRMMGGSVLRIFRRRVLLPEKPQRLLVLSIHYLGDSFWVLQAVHFLKKRFPETEIHLMLRREFGELFYGVLPPEQIHVVTAMISDRKREKVSWRAIFRALREYRTRFDCVLDLSGNRYSAIASFLLRPRCSCGFSGDEFGFLYDIRLPDEESASFPLQFRPLLAARALCGTTLRTEEEKGKKIGHIPASGSESGSGSEPDSDSEADFSLPDRMQPPILRNPLEEILRKYGIPSSHLALLMPGAGWKAKEWGDENFTETARLLKASGFHVYILGSQTEEARCVKIASDSGTDVLTGLPLGELFSLLSGAELFVGNDSGPGHISASFHHALCISLFTGATPVYHAPVGANVVALDESEAPVSPEDVLTVVRTRLFHKPQA